MANMYEGPAVLVVDGEETPVFVRAVVSVSADIKQWYGSFRSDDPRLTWRAFNGGKVVLRTPDGEEGRIITDGGDEFQGSGPPPF